MSDPHIDHLEREVEAARSRVTGDLARLRDPNAMSELKRDISYEVKAAKDRVTQSARDAASAAPAAKPSPATASGCSRQT